jgi:hypothetical protein
VVRFEKGPAVRFPGVTLVCEGEVDRPLANASIPSIRVTVFRARSGSEETVVEWSAGTGAIAPRPFDLAGRRYELELLWSFELDRALARDELVLVERSRDPSSRYRQWDLPPGKELLVRLRMRDGTSGRLTGLAAEVLVRKDGRLEATLVHRDATRQVAEALAAIGARDQLYVNTEPANGRGDASRAVARGEKGWPLAVAQELETLLPYFVDWEGSGPAMTGR